MVDVSAKAATKRTSRAALGIRADVGESSTSGADLGCSKREPLKWLELQGRRPSVPKEWIPLCHPLYLTHIDVTCTVCQTGVAVRSSVSTTAQTGVEMEALVAVSAAALTIYDMCKALDKGMEITDIVADAENWRQERRLSPRGARSRLDPFGKSAEPESKFQQSR